jgi:hypothetical protein
VVPQESVLGPLAQVNGIWRNLESTIKHFAKDNCIIYVTIMNESDIDTLHIDLDRLGEWAVENAMKINLGKSKAVGSMTAGVKDPLN